MKLGILVNTEDHYHDIIGLTKAAVERGHGVFIFTMDVGVRLFRNSEYSNLCYLRGVKMSYCDHNAKMFEAATEEIPEAISRGSQYDNAMMHHECDKVIVL
jgi:predicted peroxiredoxin